MIASQLCLVLYVLHLRVRERKNYKGRIYVNIKYMCTGYISLNVINMPLYVNCYLCHTDLTLQTNQCLDGKSVFIF